MTECTTRRRPSRRSWCASGSGCPTSPLNPAGLKVAAKIIEGRTGTEPDKFGEIASELAKYGIKVAEEPEIEINARHKIDTDAVARLISGEGNVVDAAEVFATYNKDKLK